MDHIKRIHLVFVPTILAAGMAMSRSVKLRDYYNKEFKVGVKYPSDWKVDTSTGSSPDDPAWTNLANISPRDDSLRGHLHGASATLSVAKLSPSACIDVKSPDGDESNKPVKTKIGAITFPKLSSGDVAAGTTESVETYRTFHDGRCYEITETIRQRNGVKPDRSVNMADHGLDTNVRTFYFGK